MASLRVVAGNDQTGLPDEPLPLELAVQALDGGNHPVEGIGIEWSTTFGSVSPASATTDATGLVHATWTLGSDPGPASLDAIAGPLTARFRAEAESPPAGAWGIPRDVMTPFAIPTYDGSRQVVHPDFASTPHGVMVRSRHLAITPYPGGNASFENPSIFGGAGALPWSLVPGTPNPIARSSAGYLSDPDLVFIPESNELWLYYREVIANNIIHLTRSSDGIHWTPPRQVLSAPNHLIISPTIVHRGTGDWIMWSVDGGTAGCSGPSTSVQIRRSTDGLSWSVPSPVQLTQPGLWPWHIDVQWIAERQEFWAVYNAKVAGSCATSAVFFATSTDGVVWRTYANPLLAKGAYPFFKDIVYRSTFAYDEAAQDVVLWYSGATFDKEYIWSAAVERISLSTLLARLSSPNPTRSARIFEPAPAELTDWP